ncbi:QueA S-adenosylmethionine,tRNA-ribosyltransferase-isomerase (queuine synthetase) [Rhabdaerophilaceae bacterium]
MPTKPAGDASLTLADFDFDLAEERIALHPISPRDCAKLLLVGQDELEDRVFRDLPALLRPGDLLVFNDTRVIPARLIGQRIRDQNRVAIEALLLKRFSSSGWSAFARPGKRLKVGDRVAFGGDARGCAASALTGVVMAKHDDGIVDLSFDRDGTYLDEAVAHVGVMPLPPYILEARSRLGGQKNSSDSTDYQTIFAQKDGAVAAPTASLHFTPALIQAFAESGIGHVFVTLHVGAGTFLPVKTEAIADHRMHAEWGEITAEAAERITSARKHGGRIIAVGTTVARLLETATDDDGQVCHFLGETEIFIRPGYRFKAVDALITNFHLPKSTLLMLVSAFAGVARMRAAYDHAIANGYRFFSYGDSSLLFPEVGQ